MTTLILDPAQSDPQAISRLHTRAWQGGFEHVKPAMYRESLSIDSRAALWTKSYRINKSETKDVDKDKNLNL